MNLSVTLSVFWPATGFSLELRIITVAFQFIGEVMHDSSSLWVAIVSKCTTIRELIWCISAEIILLLQSFLELDDLVLHK